MLSAIDISGSSAARESLFLRRSDYRLFSSSTKLLCDNRLSDLFNKLLFQVAEEFDVAIADNTLLVSHLQARMLSLTLSHATIEAC